MNEPVAWMMENPQNTSAYLTFEKPTREMKISHQAIPLYTAEQLHPAKTLTDEEITEIYKKVYEEGHDNQVIALARAILKRDSEK